MKNIQQIFKTQIFRFGDDLEIDSEYFHTNLDYALTELKAAFFQLENCLNAGRDTILDGMDGHIVLSRTVCGEIQYAKVSKVNLCTKKLPRG